MIFQNQKHLLSLSPHNHTTLEAINHSLFALSLDHYTYISPPAYPTPPPSPSLSHPSPLIKPDSTTEIHDHLQNLRSSHSDQPARNRWHDKTFTLVVEANTRAGAVGEHSPVDALVPNLVGEYACREGLDESAYCEMDEGDGVGCIIGGWRRLDWVVDGRIRRECVEAEERARRVVQNSDAALLVYDAYGRDYIRNEGMYFFTTLTVSFLTQLCVAGFPSDAYVQMSIQLAYYKIHKSFTATYETALTRMFKNGRTEAIRSFTKDSRAWVLAMSDSSTSASRSPPTNSTSQLNIHSPADRNSPHPPANRHRDTRNAQPRSGIRTGHRPASARAVLNARPLGRCAAGAAR